MLKTFHYWSQVQLKGFLFFGFVLFFYCVLFKRCRYPSINSEKYWNFLLSRYITEFQLEKCALWPIRTCTSPTLTRKTLIHKVLRPYSQLWLFYSLNILSCVPGRFDYIFVSSGDSRSFRNCFSLLFFTFFLPLFFCFFCCKSCWIS